MKKILFISIFLSINLWAETKIEPQINHVCSVYLYSKIYKLENAQALNESDLIYKTDCDRLISNKITQTISTSAGTISADFIKRELEKEFGNSSITISPRKLSLFELNPILKEHIGEPSNFYFLNTKSLNGIRSIGLVENEQILINCENCSSLGEKNIKIDISNSLQGKSRSLWFSSLVMAKIKVFKAKRTIGFQQQHLNPEDFYSDEIYVTNTENVLSSLENIRFFKTNKTLLQGSTITNMDLQSINLVNFGTPVKLSLKNQNINLQKIAMPTRSALFGEIIEFKNPNNNKTIAGKVIDYNKAVIEL